MGIANRNQLDGVLLPKAPLFYQGVVRKNITPLVAVMLPLVVEVLLVITSF